MTIVTPKSLAGAVFKTLVDGDVLQGMTLP
jgi:hypothetical protein